MMPTESPESLDGGSSSLREVALLAAKLGFTAFGGPAAHIAMLRDEIVSRRRWTDEAHFLDLLGAVNLIPGPNSTEMVIHTGFERAGWRGLLTAGALFILPAATMTLILAWLYVRYGTTPEGTWLLYGIKPVVIAVVLQAIWGLGRTAFRDRWLAIAGIGAGVMALLGVNELAVLFGIGGLVMLIRNARRLGASAPIAVIVPVPPGRGVMRGLAAVVAVLGAATGEPYGVGKLFLIFLKIGATLYGSGYVLLAFLQNDLVDRTGWLTRSQLLDAVAVGQFTPGPVFTTATFVGYIAGGVWGAVVATIGIFFPAFVLVAVTNPLIPRLRRSLWTAAFLDGINAAAIGLMAAVAWALGSAAIVDAVTAALAVATALLLIRFKVNSALLILAGAVIGLVIKGTG